MDHHDDQQQQLDNEQQQQQHEILMGGDATSDSLHEKAVELATILTAAASDNVPLPTGLDVLVAQLIMISERIKEENVELLDRVNTGYKNQEELESTISILQTRLNNSQENMNAAMTTASDLELDLENAAREKEILMREIRVLKKDSEVLNEKMKKELAGLELLKSEWNVKEAQLNAALKSQKKINEDLRNDAIMVDKSRGASLADNAGQDEVQVLKSIIREKDSELADLESAKETLSTESTKLSSETSLLKSEKAELLEHIRSLMEEHESYQLLLQEKTLNGEFMTSSIMKGDRRSSMAAASRNARNSIQGIAGSALASLSEELSGGQDGAAPKVSIEDENAALLEEVTHLREEVKALTLYISRILARIAVDDRLEAALVHGSGSSTTSSTTTWPFTTGTTRTAPNTPVTPTASNERGVHHLHLSAGGNGGGLSPATGGGSRSITNRTRSALRAQSPSASPRSPRIATKPGPPALNLALANNGSIGAPQSPRTSSLKGRKPPPISVIDTSASSSSNPRLVVQSERGVNILSETIVQGRSGGNSDEREREKVEMKPPGTPIKDTWDFMKKGFNTVLGALSPLPVEDGVKKELPAVAGDVQQQQ
ncbi:hypothetical protein HDU76_001111 [Blyttiomyces sp. JEL0837]|nr:hypothetical protein HDU76_001111 [Blyttiomyces sp. JEL0837]